MSNRRGQGFQSQTATRTIVDEHKQATVQELADGSRIESTFPINSVAAEPAPALNTVEEMPDGSIIITAPMDPSVKEIVPLDEPVIFTNPTQPNAILAGSRYKLAPGKWQQFPVDRKHYIRFINGHAAARTDQQVAKIKKHYPEVNGRKRVWQEPAPLLSEEKARERGLEPPYLFQNAQGKIIFWTYHRDALQEFTRSYMAHQG